MTSEESKSESVVDSQSSASISPLKKSPQKGYQPLKERLENAISSSDLFFSLEFFPPHTSQGVTNLLRRIESLAEGSPLFVDVTWNLRSDPGSLKDTSTTSVADNILNFCLLDVMVHLTSIQYDEQELLCHLERIKQIGVRNVLALRGDIVGEPPEEGSIPFPYAIKLVQLIRQHYDDYFTVCVAGYPYGHPDALSFDQDLLHLKEKVDAGADFIITQLFFTADVYFEFVRRCRQIGIHVPIIPGILPVQNYKSIQNIAKLSRIDIPPSIIDKLELIKQDEDAVRNYGIHLAVEMGRTLLSSTDCKVSGVHMYTLNQETATRTILEQLGLWKPAMERWLPWKSHPAHFRRSLEGVRPIHWNTRPKSYLCRSRDWVRFPNGRWGDSANPAFGDLKFYYPFDPLRHISKQELLDMWGRRLASIRDVISVFVDFITGRPNRQGKLVRRLPWNEAALKLQTMPLKEELLWCNRNGILTINSQPAINGLRSDDPTFGWGGPDGYIYQKAYLEFFLNPQDTTCLLSSLGDYPMVSYHMISQDGSFEEFNSDGVTPNAVIWGVFMGEEVRQPSVADPIAFRLWKDEAFDQWSFWAKLYDAKSEEYGLLMDIHDKYRLVVLVDNDFPKPNCLFAVLKAMVARRGCNQHSANITVAG